MEANTTALSESAVIIPEGDRNTISCRSVGAPVPSITWEFNNQTTGFEQTDTLTPYQASISGSLPNRVVDLSPGNIESTLHIVSARYPDHDGVYTCIGTNAVDLTVMSSSAFVTVEVHGKAGLCDGLMYSLLYRLSGCFSVCLFNSCSRGGDYCYHHSSDYRRGCHYHMFCAERKSL